MPLGMSTIESLLGGEVESLLSHECATIPREMLHLPGPGFVDHIFAYRDRPTPVLRSLQTLSDHGPLGGCEGYHTCLPCDVVHGVRHIVLSRGLRDLVLGLAVFAQGRSLSTERRQT